MNFSARKATACALYAVVFLQFSAAIAAPTSPAVDAPVQPEFPQLGLETISQHFKSYSLHTRRDVQISLNGLPQKRWDVTDIKRDDAGNLHVTKTGSENGAAFEFYVINHQAFRPDQKKSADRTVTRSAYLPLMERSSSYAESFWTEFKKEVTWDRKGSGKWGGRNCDRFEVTASKTAAESPQRLKVKGELWVDQQTNVVVKANLSAHYFAQTLGQATTATADAADKTTDAEVEEENATPPVDATENQAIRNIPEPRAGQEPFEVNLRVVWEVQNVDQIAKIETPAKP